MSFRFCFPGRFGAIMLISGWPVPTGGLQMSDSISPSNSSKIMNRFYRWFKNFAKWTAHMAGHPTAFVVAVAVIIIWALTGPFFGFSDTWQLIINTGTTIVTFLMVFLIQNTQNRDTEAMQVKLDELIRAAGGCHNAVLDIEELSEEELDTIKRGYTLLAKKALEAVRSGKSDLGAPDMEKRNTSK